MENTLHFDDRLVADIRGHSIQVSEGRYRPEQAAEDVIGRMNRR